MQAPAASVSPAWKARARAVLTPAAAATSWQNAFDVSSRAASRSGPNTAIPAARSASATPAPSGASGPTTTSSAACARASAVTAVGSSGSTAAVRTCGSPAIAAPPGATRTSFTPGSRPSFQAMACSRPPPPSTSTLVGMTRVMRSVVGRWRLGRHARSIVWVRSGPTETNTIGTPACSSSADT